MPPPAYRDQKLWLAMSSERVINPRFLSHTASYDAASNIHPALAGVLTSPDAVAAKEKLAHVKRRRGNFAEATVLLAGPNGYCPPCRPTHVLNSVSGRSVALIFLKSMVYVLKDRNPVAHSAHSASWSEELLKWTFLIVERDPTPYL